MEKKALSVGIYTSMNVVSTGQGFTPLIDYLQDDKLYFYLQGVACYTQFKRLTSDFNN